MTSASRALNSSDASSRLNKGVTPRHSSLSVAGWQGGMRITTECRFFFNRGNYRTTQGFPIIQIVPHGLTSVLFSGNIFLGSP